MNDALRLFPALSPIMRPIDANKLSGAPDIMADICIVGGGAAGITIARQLARTSLNTCLIESGGYASDETTQSLNKLENVGYPIRQNFVARCRSFGGTTNLWAGRTMKLNPIDMVKRPWVSHSGWPIAFSELQKYYAKAEQTLELPSFEKLQNDWRNFRGISAQEVRLFENTELQPHVVLWGKKPLRFGKAFKKELASSRNIHIYLNATATRIILSESGDRVESVTATTLAGKALRIYARNYVLSCGGLENARLLLFSRDHHPRGVGNRFDLVGRYYIDHPRAIFGAVKLSAPVSWPLILGSPLLNGKIQLGIGLSEKTQRKKELLNHYLTLEPRLSQVARHGYYSSINMAKALLRRGHAGSAFDFRRADTSDIRDLIYLLTPKEIIPHSLYRAYRALKKLVDRERTSRILTVINYSEQAPNFASRVYLSEKRDRFNMNVLVLDWKVGDAESRTTMYLQSILDAHLRKNRIGELDNTSAGIGSLQYTDASHHMGTTRMSSNPKEGVVDENCRVHDVDNLFIAGSSVFPTAGHANPTLTIVALSMRLADYLQAQSAKGSRPF